MAQTNAIALLYCRGNKIELYPHRPFRNRCIQQLFNFILFAVPPIQYRYASGRNVLVLVWTICVHVGLLNVYSCSNSQNTVWSLRTPCEKTKENKYGIKDPK